MYKIIKREYDLLPEEQDKARFILDSCDEWNSQQARGTCVSFPERSAFEKFKLQFYHEVWLRLFGSTKLPSVDIGKEGKTIIWISIERAKKK